MQIKVRTHHVEITEALKEYAQKKMEKMDRFFDHIQEIDIELDITEVSSEIDRQIAIAKVLLSGGVLHAKAKDRDMYAAIDAIYDKLEIQLKKHKEKLKERRHKDRHKRSLDNGNGRPGASSPPKRVKDVKHYFDIKPIDIEDAAQKLVDEHLGFLVFREQHSEHIHIVYEMEDGSVGLIET